MVEMIWKEPPPAVSSEKAAILAELQKHPGRWALVGKDKSSSAAADPWKKLGCEATYRRTNQGDKKPLYDVYARWPEQKASALKPGYASGGSAVARAAGPGTYDPGQRDARGVPSNGLPVESLRR